MVRWADNVNKIGAKQLLFAVGLVNNKTIPKTPRFGRKFENRLIFA
jgi:hypothetical protein